MHLLSTITYIHFVDDFYIAGCSFVGKGKSKLMEHCRTHTGEKVAACPQCGSLFASNTKFKDHLIRQDTLKNSQFSCSICYHTYPSERLLREHVRRHINTLKCPYCDLTCNGPSRLQHHIHFRHKNDTPEQCPVCQKRFKTGHCLSEHLETHGHKTFQCSISGCKYMGKTLKAWQSHMKKMHMPDRKDYCCHICGECFLGGMKLSTHLKTIHGFQLPPGHSRFRYDKHLHMYLQYTVFYACGMLEGSIVLHSPSFCRPYITTNIGRVDFDVSLYKSFNDKFMKN